MNNMVQWNLSIKDTRNKGHFPNEDIAVSTTLKNVYKSTSEIGTLSIQDSQLGPNGASIERFHCIPKLRR